MLFIVLLSKSFSQKFSNYKIAKKQSQQVFSKFMGTSEGRDAINTMIERGIKDNHFKFVSASKAKQVMAKPQNFLHQTEAWKEASHSTKIRHVSNSSNINKILGSSLNISQKCPGILANASEWSLSAFTMYTAGYSSDISSAYKKIQV